MRVLVADDNEIVRLGLRALLSRLEDVEDVLEARDGIEALERVAADRPDILLLDVRMPRLDGIGVLDALDGSVPVLMLTHSEESDIVRLAMDRGARGYLVHGAAGPEEIAGALHTCIGGGMVLSAAAARALARPAEPVAQGEHPFAAVLTEREFAVLEAAAEGKDNAIISRDQFLAPRTVKNYLNAAYAKLGVHSRAEAVASWHEAARPPSQPGTGGDRGGGWPYGMGH